METCLPETFFQADLRVGTVIRSESFPEARKPALKLWIDFGGEIGVRTSSAQLTGLYSPDTLPGRQVIAVVNFPARQVGPFMSQCLVLAATSPDGKQVVLLGPDRRVPDGWRIA